MTIDYEARRIKGSYDDAYECFKKLLKQINSINNMLGAIGGEAEKEVTLDEILDQITREREKKNDQVY